MKGHLQSLDGLTKLTKQTDKPESEMKGHLQSLDGLTKLTKQTNGQT